ncbi:MAG: ABC transporter ATP-binding protein [Ilumatobacter sp.]|nr:ABC transporter ATP-binding protein [Ilumatobacter sp.]
MATGDVVVDGLWKTFRIYQQRSSTLKQAVLRRGNEVYEEFWALRDVTFEVPAGTTVGLIGANGAGKSTMLKVLSRILVPDKGSVHVDGKVSALLELGAGFHPELSGRENVFLNGTILGMTQADINSRFDEIVAFAGLEHAIDNTVKTYSSGMQARLGFAVAVAIEPDILIVDEVLAVGDEEFQRRSLERMNELRSGGRTAILVSHGLATVQQVCDTAVWLDHGQVKAVGGAEDVINQYLRSVSPDVRLDAKGREHLGSGEIEVDVEITSGGSAVDAIESGTPIEVDMRWRADTPLTNLRFQFLVHATDGQVVAGDVIHDESVNSVGAGPGGLCYSVPGFDLLPGSYHLSVSVTDAQSGHLYDSATNVAHLDVHPRGSQIELPGYVPLGGRWTRRG